MNDLERQQLLCNLVRTMKEKGSWAGETHIQKSVLFLQDFLQVPLDYKFVMYKHGPYSYGLRRELGHMLDGFMMELRPNSGYGPSYFLGERGERYAMQHSEFAQQIEFVSENVSPQGTRALERVSTAFYVRLKEKSLSGDPIRTAQRMCEIKPHIKIEDAIDAVSEVEGLRSKAQDAGLTVAEI